MTVNGKCAECSNMLDCHSEYLCYNCLLKRRARQIRYSYGGLNPYNLSENVKTNKNKLGIEIIGET